MLNRRGRAVLIAEGCHDYFSRLAGADFSDAARFTMYADDADMTFRCR